MALSINTVALAGNLSRDAEYIQTQSGTTICKFSVAVSKRVKDSSGNWKDDADFFEIVGFGNLYNSFEKNGSLTKGTPVSISGRLQLERWQNKQGENRSRVSVIADTVIPFNRNNSGNNSGNNYSAQEQNLINTMGGKEVPF